MSTEPRKAGGMWGSSPASYGESGDTWLEAESFCYPNGGMTRRARVKFPDGKFRIVRCGIHDTAFSIPVRKSDADGWVGMNDDGEWVFNPHTKRENKL